MRRARTLIPDAIGAEGMKNDQVQRKHEQQMQKLNEVVWRETEYDEHVMPEQKQALTITSNATWNKSFRLVRFFPLALLAKRWLRALSTLAESTMTSRTGSRKLLSFLLRLLQV